MLLRQPAVCDRSLALPKTGSNSAARMAMMAMTTSSSTSVNARIRCCSSNFMGFVLPCQRLDPCQNHGFVGSSRQAGADCQNEDTNEELNAICHFASGTACAVILIGD